MSIALTSEKLPLRVDADGVVRVSETRVSLDTLIAAFEDGATAEEIAQQYSTVTLADVYAVIAYYLRQRDEVNAYLLERRSNAGSVRKENEARFNPRGIRERLLARRAP